jgi:signal peptidase I
MEETNPVTTPGTELAVPSITDGALYLGDDLNIDIWIKPQLGKRQSFMLRKIDAQGNVRSSFMHIDEEEVRRIPIFSNQVGLEVENAPVTPAVTAPVTESEVKPVRRKEKKVKPPKQPKAPKPPKAIKAPKQPKQPRSPKVRKVEIAESTRSNFHRVRKITSTALLIAFVAALLTGVLQLRTILTGSMIPALRPGDLIVGISPHWVAPSLGDVVVYGARDLEGRVVSSWSHRIVGGNAKEGFTVKGDANPAADLNHPKLADIQSVVLFKVPYIGKFFKPITVLLLALGISMLVWVKRQL